MPLENVPPITEVPMTPILCNCKVCRDCLHREIERLSETPCTCTYKEVTENITHEDGTIEVITKQVIDVMCERCKAIEAVKLTLSNYDLFEKAHIPQEEWPHCKVHEGMIFTSQKELDSFLNPAPAIPTEAERLSTLETSQEMTGLIIDDLLFEVIPSIESRMPNVTKTIQAKMATFTITDNKGGNMMAVALAKGIIKGRDYATVFKCLSYKQYQDEVDAILVLEGYGHLIVKA